MAAEHAILKSPANLTTSDDQGSSFWGKMQNNATQASFGYEQRRTKRKFQRHKSTMYNSSEEQHQRGSSAKRLTFSFQQDSSEKEDATPNSHHQPLESQQQASNSDHARPSIILFRTRKPHTTTTNLCDSYPPPKHLQPPLAENIKKILLKDGNQEAIQLLQKQNEGVLKRKRNRFTSKRDRQTFINPKSIQLLQKKNFSRIQKQFINTYQDQFVVDGKQGITEHPNAVSAILYSGLCASAIASYDWNSVAAKRRLTEEVPESPEIKFYPLTKDGIKEIEATNQKITQSREREFDKRSDRQHQEITCKMILEQKCKNLNQYTSEIRKIESAFQRVYGTPFGEYQDVLEFCDATKEDHNKFNINQAEKDVQFIKDSRHLFDQDPAYWVLTRHQKELLKEQNLDPDQSGESNQKQQKRAVVFRRRRMNKERHLSQVYGVRPNRVTSSGVAALIPKEERRVRTVKSRYLDFRKARKPYQKMSASLIL